MPYSHDQNFKNLILDYPQQALEFFAESESPIWGVVYESRRSARSN